MTSGEETGLIWKEYSYLQARWLIWTIKRFCLNGLVSILDSSELEKNEKLSSEIR